MGQPRPLDPSTVSERYGAAYPTQFGDHFRERYKRALGDALGLTGFGVNLVRMEPGAWSAHRHWHTSEDEFVYVLEGEITLVTDAGEETLRPGTAAGFPAGVADGHHLINRSDRPALYLEIGNRSLEDNVHYSDIDLFVSRRDGLIRHKNGEPY